MTGIISLGIFKYLTYITLGLAIASRWISRKINLPIILFAVGIVAVLISQRISFYALPSIILFAVATYYYFTKKTTTIAKFILAAIIFTLGVGFILHKIPGFNNWQIYSNIKLSDASAPFSVWLNFDKPLIGLFIALFAFTPMSKFSEFKEMLKIIYPYIIVSTVLLLAPALLIGYVEFDPKLPEISLLWLARNLLFVCIAEEMFFRLFIQNGIINIFQKSKYKNMIALILASLIFGLGHFAGGLPFMVLSFIAGIFYGLVYIKSGKIEASILTHFIVNSVHFFLLTYPYAV